MNEDSRGEPGLFDLPLDPPPPSPDDEEAAAALDADPAGEPAAPGRREGRRASRPGTLPLFSENEIEEHLAEHLPGAAVRKVGGESVIEPPSRPRPVAVPPPAPAPATAGLGRRARAAAADLVILAAVGLVAAVGATALEAPVGPAQLGPLALFVLVFSFVYFVVSLAFWGSTPGMTWAGLVARTGDSEPLSFGQTALRWLGTWLTWALAGLPGLLALTGRSLADRLSGSRTLPSPGAA